MGRIIETHPGSDGLTRVVSIRGPKNTNFKRPITKITLLPTEDNHKITPDEDLIKDNNKKEATKVCSQKMTRSGKIYAPLLMLLITFNLCVASAPPFNITKFVNEPGIYFESFGELKFTNNDWNIIVYYNLTDYYGELTSYKRCLDRLTKICSVDNDNLTNSSFTKRSRANMCGLIEPSFKQSLEEMEHKDQLLHHHKVNFGRTKRGALNIVGNIASGLFGVLDDRDAARYEEEIEKLKLNNNHFTTLLKNQTSIIDATINVFKKRQEDIDNHWLVFKRQLEEALENNNQNSNFLALSMHTMLLMISFKEVQDTLIEAVLDTHNRVTTTKLLTIQQLKNEVDFMSRSLPTELVLPNIEDTDDMLALYQLMTTKTKLQGKYLIFEVKIPLVYREVYQIYKPISLPTTKSPSIFIRPQMELLVTDLHRHSYSSITNFEWQNCISTNNFRICKLNQAIHLNQEEDTLCELALLRQEGVTNQCEIVERNAIKMPDTWIQLQDHRWLFSVSAERIVSIVCQQKPFSAKISNSGLLSLGLDCTLKGRTLSIPARQSFHHNVYSSLLPTVNLSGEIANMEPGDHSYYFQELSKTRGIEELHRRISEMSTGAEESLSYHHIHHYAVTYGLLALAAMIILCVVIKKLIKKNKRVTANEDNPVPLAPLGPIR